ncbi:MAG: phenol hydroxylase [Nevskiaceae bacterium]|nr:MAG: phenol hydroxylase [Nevskiaceae bacterium]TBR72665.1 MAG: phenol hydroxylase [Nevskiaceae bacterium]
MPIELRTITIEPLRNNYDHLEKRFGHKPASRYQEASYDIQPVENLHYRPTWDPDQTLYDPTLSRIRMRDWYDLKDPRQLYYGSYTQARARQQDTEEANFEFVESNGLVMLMTDALRQQALDLLVPLRHVAWGADQNNMMVCGYGYGTTFKQPCVFYALDQLGIAQYLSRLGLLLGGQDALVAGKQAWMEAPAWQDMRRYVEDVMAVRDPVEVFVAQDVVLDGLLYPLVYERLVDDLLAVQGGTAVSMLTQFMTRWGAETRRWSDSVVKTMAAESAENRAVLEEWITQWGQRAVAALAPLARPVAVDTTDALMTEQIAAFAGRAAKAGVTIKLEH